MRGFIPLILIFTATQAVYSVKRLKFLPQDRNLFVVLDKYEWNTLEAYIECTNTSNNDYIIIQLLHSDYYSPNEPLFELNTFEGDLLSVYQLDPFLTDVHVRYLVQADEVSSKIDSLATVLAAFGNEESYDSLKIVRTKNATASDAHWNNAILEALTLSKLWAASLDIDFGFMEQPDEASLLFATISTETKDLSLRRVPAWRMTNMFFQDNSVHQIRTLNLQEVERNDISDMSLSKLSTTRLVLGHAPSITAEGLRNFLQPVVNSKRVHAYVEFFNPDLKLDPHALFKKEERKEKTTVKRRARGWTLERRHSNSNKTTTLKYEYNNGTHYIMMFTQ